MSSEHEHNHDRHADRRWLTAALVPIRPPAAGSAPTGTAAVLVHPRFWFDARSSHGAGPLCGGRDRWLVPAPLEGISNQAQRQVSAPVPIEGDVRHSAFRRGGGTVRLRLYGFAAVSALFTAVVGAV